MLHQTEQSDRLPGARGAVSGSLLLVGPLSVSLLTGLMLTSSFLTSWKSLPHPSWRLQSGMLQRGRLVKPITAPGLPPEDGLKPIRTHTRTEGASEVHFSKLRREKGEGRCTMALYSQWIL